MVLQMEFQTMKIRKFSVTSIARIKTLHVNDFVSSQFVNVFEGFITFVTAESSIFCDLNFLLMFLPVYTEHHLIPKPFITQIATDCFFSVSPGLEMALKR